MKALRMMMFVYGIGAMTCSGLTGIMGQIHPDRADIAGVVFVTGAVIAIITFVYE